MPVNIFDPEYLDAAVDVVPNIPGFFKKTFFGTDKLLPTTDVYVDFKRGTRRIASFLNPNGTTPVVSKNGYKTNHFETPLVGNKDVTTIQDTLRRLPGELLVNSGVTPDQRAMNMLVEALTDLNDYITRREEYMCVMAMMTGSIPVVGENVNYTIDFGFSNNIALTQKWDASDATCDPTKDLDSMCSACRRKGYRNPNIVIMDPQTAWPAFEKRCMALGLLDQKNFLNLDIQPSIVEEGVTFMGKLRKPNVEIYTYEDWYIDDWTNAKNPETKPLMPKGKILVGSTNSEFKTYYGILGGVDEQGNDLMYKEGTRMAESWMQRDPAARFLKETSRPLPCPTEVDSWAVAEVASRTEGDAA